MKKCRQCLCEFPITDKDMEFYTKVSPMFPVSSSGGTKDPVNGDIEHGFFLSSEGRIQMEGEKTRYLIPPPTLCPDCRQQRRLSFHNERHLYKRKCDATGKDIISIYSPDKAYTVYHQDYWWSDAWDPKSYGREFDFSKSFFEQYKELFTAIPKQGLIAKDCEKSEYVNFVWKVEQSYLISAASFDEHCYYGNRVTKSKKCIDTFLVKECELCYQCTDTNNSYNCFFSEKLSHCQNCEYCTSCEGCDNCFLSTNLQNKKYFILNQPYSKEEYFEKIHFIKKGGPKELLKMKGELLKTTPHKDGYVIQSENAYGNAIRNAKDVICVYDGDMLENVKYSAFVDDVYDAYDINYGYGETRLQYDSLGTGEKSYGVLFCINVWPDISHMLYCDTCTGCHHCFGCIGLRNASYCILNRQYTKEEYEELVPRIIEHMSSPKPSPQGEGGGNNSSSLKERGLGGEVEWGEFFPASMSPFGYNETVANEYYPIASPQPSPQGEGVSRTEEGNTFRRVWIPSPPSPLGEGVMGGGGTGFWCNWSDYESPFPSVAKVIPASKLPDTIDSIPDDILNWAIECEVSGKPFRIIKQELEFYRKHHLPIPRRHPDQRHLDRMKMRNPRKLFERLCDCPHCEENSREKGIILREGENAGYRELEQNPQSSATLQTAPLQRSLKKRMITTYSPERSEIVYCSTCYDKEVLS